MTNFPPSARPPMGAALPSVSYVGPILATLFCCLIPGIVSIVYTAKANTAAATGNGAEYGKLVGTRKTWLMAAIVIGLLIAVLQIVLYIAGAGAAATGMGTTP